MEKMNLLNLIENNPDPNNINYLRMKTRFIIAVLALIAFTSLANAQDKGQTQAQQQSVTPAPRGAYVDANNNGICDYYERPGIYYRYGRRMANISAARGNRQGLPVGQGRGYGRGLGPGYGRGLGPGQGRGLAPGGRFFVDEDKNGICDFYERTVKN